MAEELHFDNPAAAAQDPSTDAEALRQLAYRYPELRPVVAAHPRAYRGLLDWLHQFNDPAINAALEARDDTTLHRLQRLPRYERATCPAPLRVVDPHLRVRHVRAGQGA